MIYNSYSDPIDSVALNSWLWNATSKWDYLYMVTTRNTIPWWGFVLLSLAGWDSNSNWVVCDNWEWNIPAWYDLSDFNLCSSLVEWNVCSNDFKWNCTYSSKGSVKISFNFLSIFLFSLGPYRMIRSFLKKLRVRCLTLIFYCEQRSGSQCTLYLISVRMFLIHRDIVITYRSRSYSCEK